MSGLVTGCAGVMPPERTAKFDACSLIIEKRGRQRRRERVVLAGLALLFWSLWGLLWQPMINSVGWLFAAMLGHRQFVELEGWRSVVDKLPWFLLVVASIDGSLILWALINWGRFAGRERRRTRREVTSEELAANFAQLPEDIEVWQQSRRLVAHFDDSGRLAQMEGDPAAVAPAA